MAAPYFSAHIGYLFRELDFERRFAAAAEAGFRAIEHPFVEEHDALVVRRILAENGLRFSQIACAFGQAKLWEKGLAALPGREWDFRDNFDQCLDFALAIDCPLIHPMAGVPTGASPDAVKDTYLRNIDYAVEKTMRLPIKILIEPISHHAVPGYALNSMAQAASVQDIFGPGNLSLLVDTFHAAADGFDLPPWIRQNSYRIGHVHVADHGGRKEPGTGCIDFEPILNTLVEEGYDAAIGFEYDPSRTTLESLDFLPVWKQWLISEADAVGSTTTAGV
ncbi:hydroxypyruvate isomerase [Pseudorhizobium endolithicum]|uniref:Hydroxypyruvate isomerase n=1 Tax=Pseudorhizobium endolithicum TaxID=1191678 RepID=A0ABN7JMQ6_9HYPH|nr:TIM barrel protein [Pseudorhizobium endolithicum]CAD7037204.1 hydroxypyruvate isomerase [Pseudorhizobium endolithicum]